MTPRKSNEEIARLGEEIYQRDIRPLVETEHRGQVVTIDIDSGRWGLGKNVLEARAQLDRQQPNVTDAWSVRVGFRALHRFGYRQLRSRR